MNEAGRKMKTPEHETYEFVSCTFRQGSILADCYWKVRIVPSSEALIGKCYVLQDLTVKLVDPRSVKECVVNYGIRQQQ